MAAALVAATQLEFGLGAGASVGKIWDQTCMKATDM
jgi:hypothetical protein